MTEKENLLRKINEAFANSDTEFIVANVTDDIRWNVIGDKVVEGKQAFREALKAMEFPVPLDLEIHKVITHGDAAAVNGVMKVPGTNGKGQAYAFCDIYQLSGFKNPKIKSMTSYAIEIKL